jgi:Peptidase A4 family
LGYIRIPSAGMQRWLALLVSLAVVATVAVPSAAVVVSTGTAHAVPFGSVFGGISSSSAYNWAGYAESSGTGSVTKVTATWTEPSVTCTKKGTTLAAFWIGIDGYSSNTVEQDGTLAQCSHGAASYVSWWETYPANAVQTFASIHAGDKFNATVSYNSATGKFTMSITDITSGTTWTKLSKNSGASENSAECIAERPAGANNASGLYALANFGTVSFGSCAATVSGSTGGIGTFSTVYEITMVNYSSGTRMLASPSSLTGKSAFTVTWKHAS